MEELKAWIKGHKALAIGGGLALVVLLYLWLRSGSSQQTATDPNAGLNAYYGAQAAAAGDTAATAQSTNALDAATAKTNAQEAVDLAAIQAQATPYTDQLQALTQQNNITAYHDYLAEQTASAQPPNAAVFGGRYVQTTGSGSSTFYDLSTNQWLSNLPGNPLAGIVTMGEPYTTVTWAGPGSQPQTPGQPMPALTFAQFVGSNLTPTPTPTATTTAAAA